MSVVYECEQCGSDVREEDAVLDESRGYREIVSLAFCPDCVKRL